MYTKLLNFDLSLALKALGYNEECSTVYRKDGSSFSKHYSDVDPTNSLIEEGEYFYGSIKGMPNVCTAPLIGDVIDWFAAIDIIIHQVQSAKIWYWCVSTKDIYCREFKLTIEEAIMEAILLKQK